MPQQMIWFFVSIAFSLIAWGIVMRLLITKGAITAEEYATLIAEARPKS